MCRKGEVKRSRRRLDGGNRKQKEERQGGVGIETVLYGHGSSLSSGVLFIPAVKNDPHAYGSAISYGKRYSLLMACGLGSKDDDDGNKAVEAIKRQAEASKTIKPKTTVRSDF